MIAWPVVSLADRIALAIIEHGPTSGSRLAAAVAVRKADVMRELRTNPRFDHVGRGRGSKWRYVGNRESPPWEPMGPNPGEGLGVDTGSALGDRLAALERRVAALERQAARGDAGVPAP